MQRRPSRLSLFGVLALLSGCGKFHRLPDYGPIPNFDLVSQTGRRVTLEDLKGKVWIADTFFTTCTGPCPMMSARMRRLALDLGAEANVRLVSLTVDPEHDTQEALEEYSSHFHARPEQWSFLTGPREAVNRVTMDGLHLSRVDGSLEHSTKFALVDRHARVRGYYLSFDQSQMKQLVADARWLAVSP